ncbi:MAG: right-handed parallel beta-helix repeat-containing protein [bacterium]
MKRSFSASGRRIVFMSGTLVCFFTFYLLFRVFPADRKAGAAQKSVLSWSGEPGFAADGIDPQTGVPADTLFSYRIKYISADDVPPAPGYPKVHIKSAGIEILGSPFSLTEDAAADISLKDGKLYTFKTTLAEGEDYTYCFEALDANGEQADGNPTDPVCAPRVAGSIFVDTGGGNDTTGNGSPATPYKTISGGLKLAVSGQTIRVRPGVYEETIIMKKGVSVVSESGAAQTVLTASGEGGLIQNGAVVTFAGKITGCTLAGFDISKGRNGEGGVFLKASGEGISGITISNCIIHDNTGPGIRLAGPVSVTISDNEIFRNSCAGISSLAASSEKQGEDAASQQQWENAIGELTITSEDRELPLTIWNNTIHHNSGAGIALKSADGGIGYRLAIGGPDPRKGNQIYSNIRAGIALGGIGQATVQNNFLSSNCTPRHTYAAGLVVQDVSPEGSLVSLIQDNDISNHPRPAIKIEGASSLIIKNNDLFNNGGGIVFPAHKGSALWSLRPVVIRGNRIHNNSNCSNGITKSNGSQSSDSNAVWGSAEAGSGIILGSFDAVGASFPAKITITRNELAQNLGTGIAIWVTCEAEITQNSIYGNLGGGGGIFTGGGNPFLIIRNNKIHHNLIFTSEAGIDVRHAGGTIENNLIFRNSRGGIRFGDGICAIIQNTVVYNGSQTRGGGIVYGSLSEDPNVKAGESSDGLVMIRNNISAFNETEGLLLGGEDALCPDNPDAGDGVPYRDYNLVYGNYRTSDNDDGNDTAADDCGWAKGPPYVVSCIQNQYGRCGLNESTGSARGADGTGGADGTESSGDTSFILTNPDDIIADPLFVNPAGDNYHLKAVSLAIGAGYGDNDIGAYGGENPLSDGELLRQKSRRSKGAVFKEPVSLAPLAVSSPFSFISSGTATRIIRVTDNFYQDAYPHLQGDLLTWQAFLYPSAAEGKKKNWEIFVCHLPTETWLRITDNDTDDRAPQTNGQYVVWQGQCETGSEIFLYRWKTWESIRITRDTSEDFFPRICGDWIVWTSRQRKNDMLQPGEILLYRIPTQETFNLSGMVDQNNIRDDTSPRIQETPEGTLVSWSREEGEDSLLYLYNLDFLGEPGVFPQAAPRDFLWPEDRQTSGSLQVTSRSDGSEREIFVYRPDVNRYRQLTNNEYDDRYPSLHGNRAAWMAGDGEGAEIFAAFLDPNSFSDAPYDPNPLITDDPPPDPPVTPPPASDPNTPETPGQKPPPEVRSIIEEPPTRCFISSCCAAGCRWLVAPLIRLLRPDRAIYDQTGILRSSRRIAIKQA